MKSVEELREQAARARRLAASILDPQTQAALTAFALECEANVAAIEARAAASKARQTLD